MRSRGVPCSLYIDDRLNGEVFNSSGPCSAPSSARSDDFRFLAPQAAIFVVLSLLVRLGYTIGIVKFFLAAGEVFGASGFCRRLNKTDFFVARAKDGLVLSFEAAHPGSQERGSH